jgi:RHS repeat-associated protein
LEYVSDGCNRRAGTKVNGTLVRQYVYQSPLQIAAAFNQQGRVLARFVYASCPHVPEYMTKQGTTYRFITDHLGSVRLVVDAQTGAVAQRLDYDEFGRVLQDTNPGFQPFGFAGGLYDPATQLVRFGARDYDPETGRWTSKDPILFGGRQTNIYGYNFSDPVNFIDPSGLWGISVTTGTTVGTSELGSLGNGQVVATSSGIIFGSEGSNIVLGGTTSVGTGNNVSAAVLSAGLSVSIILGDVSTTSGPGTSKTGVFGPISTTAIFDSAGNYIGFSVSLWGFGGGFGTYTTKTNTTVCTVPVR